MKKVLVLFHQWVDAQPLASKWLRFLLVKIEKITLIPDSKGFLKNLAKLLVFNRLSSVFSLFIGIISARVLGPVEYGRVGLVGNIAGFLFLPMIMGSHNSMYKFLPESDGVERQKLMSTALIGNILTTVLFSGIFFSFSTLVAKYFRIPPEIWLVGVLFTVVINFNILTESFLRGQKKYNAIANLKLVSSGVFFSFIVLFLLITKPTQRDFTTYYLCVIISLLFFIGLGIWQSGLNLTRLRFSRPVAQRIYSLGIIVVISMIFTTILNFGDLFIVNYFYPGREVGIYNVYQGFVKNAFTVIFFEVFAVVFMPTIATMDKQVLYQKINRFIYWLLPIITVLTGMITALTILMFGKEYELSLKYIILVSVNIGFYFIFQVYYAIFSMEGNQGAKLCLIPLVVTLPFSLLLQFLLTKYWGITGTMVAVLLTNLTLVLVFKLAADYRYKAA